MTSMKDSLSSWRESRYLAACECVITSVLQTLKPLGCWIVIGDLEEERQQQGRSISWSFCSSLLPKTDSKQLAARRNQERVKSILLLAIPDEYLLKFYNVADAKSTLGGKYKSRFQKLISQFEVHGDSNSKGSIKPEVPLNVSNSASQNLAFLSSETLSTVTNDRLDTAVEDFGHYGGDALGGISSVDGRSGRNQGRRSYGDNSRSNAPTNESSSLAHWLAQDGLGGYDWSNDFEVNQANYAFMADLPLQAHQVLLTVRYKNVLNNVLNHLKLSKEL
ncbi:hypothetical protein Tco_0702473 [Tanacetum coccineum]|uniref:Uncharacterized protein n=1 Tax=Tanacetum coccineum TaxID=301880 RepID=A0ABQ4XWW5_9ASTR